MTVMSVSNRLISLFLISLLLTACGGGTSNNNSKKPNDETNKSVEKASESETTKNSTDSVSETASSEATNTNTENKDEDVQKQENEDQQNTNQDSINQNAFNWDKLSGWHTQGIVSKKSPIQINFNRDVVDAALVGKDASKVMFISPAIKGNPVFESKSKITWQPQRPLIPGTTYKVSIKPLGFKDVPSKVTPFQFTFNVIPLEYQINTFGLETISEKPDEMVLKGQLLVSDSVPDLAVTRVLKADLQDKALPVEWLHDENGKQHNFIIRGIKRDSFESTLKLNWNGDKINIKTKGQKDISIPSTNTFEITNIDVVHKEKSIPFVEIRFSDEVDRTQNLNGLVELTKNKHSVSVKSNVINIYPKRNITGEYIVKLHKGIKAKHNNKLLNEEVEQKVNFNDAKPQVKFAGKGTILPPNAILDIPFDAVGVNAVDVTAFKIYPENIPQFLQLNRLSGSSQINRGGRYLWRKTIPLKPADPNQWNRYSFNVTDLMKEHPGGLLRLSISIKRRHSSYGCPTSTIAPEKRDTLLKNWEDNGVKQASGWDGISDYVEDNYYNYNYSWEERNNPCSDSYYAYGNNSTISQQNFIASNIGLITKQDAKGNLQVISTDLRTAKPLTGTEFEVRNFQGQVLSKGTSDGSGFANIELTKTPFLLVAKKFEDTTYLKLNTKTALAVSHFDVGGEKIKKGLKGYIYGERGVWRPGDDIFLTFVLQNKSSSGDGTEAKLPEKYPVTMKLIDPQGRIVKTKTSTDSVGGFYAFKFKTAEKAQTGNWLIKAFVGGSTFSKSLMIETVRPNRLKLELSFKDMHSDDDKKEAEVLYSSDGEVKGTLFSQWLHGATANKLKADISVKFSKKKTTFGKYTDYVFDDPARNLRSKDQALLEGRLDEEGYLRFNKKLKVDGKPAGMLKAKFTSRVFEDGGVFSISRSNVDYHPYENYVGLKLPKGDDTRGMLLTDVMHSVNLASLNAKGEDVSLDKVQVSLYKIHWKWWWDKSADSLAQYANSKHKQLLQQDTVNTKEGSGEWKFQIKYPQWGRYLIRACDLQGNHCTGKTVYIDWPGWAGRAQEEGSGAASRLNLFSDKPAYNVGETAIIQLPAAVQGRALLTVETGSQILQQRWVDFEQASRRENQENRVQFKIDITENMAPNIYVHMTLLQPHEGKRNDRPIRLYGIIPIKVSNPKSYLLPKLEASNEWRPESKQTVKVREDNGLEMNYTLAVVDEGLLGLTSFKTPNLHRYFYRKEALGIKTWDLFDEVVGAYGGKLERMLALGGGDEEENEDDDSKKRRFPPVVKYFGPFNLKAGETAEHEVELPPYLGAVRVMLVAGNTLSNTNAYGRTQQEIFVRQPLMLQTSLPRVLGPNEEVAIPVSLFVMDETIKQVNISLETDDLVNLVDSTEQQISIEKAGEKTAFIKIKAGEKTGKTKFKFTATAGANNKHISTKEVYLDIRRANQQSTRSITKVLEANSTWESKAEAFGIAGTNQTVLELSSIPSLNLEKRLSYLTRYPHGCLEQVTSAVFPQLYLSNVMTLTEIQQKETEHNVHQAIEKLQRFQNNSGNFNYWPSNGANNPGNRNEWASIYAGHFLIEAKKLGYVVPTSLLRKWLKYQSSTAQQYVTGNKRYSHTQAYRLYALALAGKPQLGAMNRLREAANINNAKTLNNKARWLLASTYQTASQPTAAESLIQGMSLDVDDVENSDQTFSSTLGDLALRLDSLVALNKKQDANKLLEQIAAEMSGDSYQNTQGIAWALMSVARYLDGDTSSFTAQFSEDGTITKIDSKKSLARTRLLESDAPITLKNTSGVKLFANLISNGVPVAGNEIDQANGLTMSVNYSSRSDTNKNLWVTAAQQADWKVLQGNDNRITVTLTNNSKRKQENIALTIPAAAGMEILSATEQTTDRSKYDYRDLRDDRIHYYFSLKKGKSKTFELIANASYQGRYYQPAITAEAMYDGNIKATKKGRWIHIVKTLINKETKPAQTPNKEAAAVDAQ